MCSSDLVAGAVNAVAGGGTILTFPVLAAILPADPARLVTANATSTIGLWPGAVAAAWAYRGERVGQPPWTVWLAVPSLVGAAVGAVLAFVLAAWNLPVAVEAGLLVALNLIGVPICSRAAASLGRGSDPGAIVYDEAASLPLALLVIPSAARSPLVIAAAFLLHRVFDISKLPPGRQVERLPKGLGIMADDWAAAGWAAACLALARGMGWL